MNYVDKVGPVKNENSTKQESQQTPHRLQLLAQAIEKVESEYSQKQSHLLSTNKQSLEQTLSESIAMAPPQQQEFLMKIFAQQNMATVMAAAAAAAQIQAQNQKSEPISPPSTSSASSSAESPIDFSSRRSSEENLEYSSPSSPVSNHQNQQLLVNMLQNLQPNSSNGSFPFLLANKNGKPTRPFKAYPRDPLMLPLGFCSNTGNTNASTPIEQTSLLVDAMSRSATSRKRFAQTQERLKQRLHQQHQTQQQQIQQQQTAVQTQNQQPYFISSSGAQILQPPKKRHRTITNEDLLDSTTSVSIISTTNISTPPTPSTPSTSLNVNDESSSIVKDDAYWERRRKNNEAAKRSRDARRAKEDEIALRAAILEQENIKLRLEVSQLKQETAKLRCMVYTPS